MEVYDLLLPPECVCDPRHRCFVAFDVRAVVACLKELTISVNP